MVALGFLISSCGSGTNKNDITTSAAGNWEAQLTGGLGQAAQLNFITSFSVTDTTGTPNEPLDITGFGFINAGACFPANGLNDTGEIGSATLVTNNAGQVSGSMTYVISSASSSNRLTLTTLAANGFPLGGVSGTSNGTTTTTGTLSNGIVWGNWQLTGGDVDPSCQGEGNFIMCQGVATCTIP
jgi:hypothetical protein